MNIKYIGSNIFKLRIARGLTQEALGMEIGLTPSAISNIEKSISYPSIDTLIRLAEFFGVTLDYLSTDKYSEQFNELELKGKLLVTEQYLSSEVNQKFVCEIGNKTYSLEENESGINYSVKLKKENHYE